MKLFISTVKVAVNILIRTDVPVLQTAWAQMLYLPPLHLNYVVSEGFRCDSPRLYAHGLPLNASRPGKKATTRKKKTRTVERTKTPSECSLCYVLSYKECGPLASVLGGRLSFRHALSRMALGVVVEMEVPGLSTMDFWTDGIA